MPGVSGYSSLALSYLPRPDGRTLTKSPEVLIREGKYTDVPLIVGVSLRVSFFCRGGSWGVRGVGLGWVRRVEGFRDIRILRTCLTRDKEMDSVISNWRTIY